MLEALVEALKVLPPIGRTQKRYSGVCFYLGVNELYKVQPKGPGNPQQLLCRAWHPALHPILPLSLCCPSCLFLYPLVQHPFSTLLVIYSGLYICLISKWQEQYMGNLVLL